MSVFILEVSVVILFVVSVVIMLLVLVSGLTVVVESLVDLDSLLLLQAAKEAAIIAIAKNFFIFKFLGLLTIDLGFILSGGKR